MSDYPDDLRNKLIEGEISLHELEHKLDAELAAELRCNAIEEWTDTTLETVQRHDFDAEKASNSNIENLIGSVQIPLGIAGPLEITGEYSSGEYYIPLATTEGTLVASANRGCSVVTDSGGAHVRILKNAMTRAPVFRAENIEHSHEIANWAEDNFSRLRNAAEETTDHGELLWVDSYIAGDNVYLRFGYDTKDAMGMNMATGATRAASEVVEDETNASLVSLSGNVCADKKPAAINTVEGRGKTVCADVTIERKIVENKLKTTPEAIFEVNKRKTLIGSTRAATIGANAHVANIVAAVFAATGQDLAQVVEASSAMTTMSLKDEGLYVSVTIPALELGTVGGGTDLQTQDEVLSMLGVDGSGDPPGRNASEFAEILAGATLAGELSLHAALASQHLSEAHMEFGR